MLSGLISFSVVLAVALLYFQVAIAVPLSIGAALVLAVMVAGLRLGGRKLLSRIAWRVVVNAVEVYSTEVKATGIGDKEGSVVIRLAVGSNDNVAVRSRFEVSNTATKERWGTVEVVELEEASCVCRVFDRIKVDFWDVLESRMGKDPSPPAGVAFTRQVPEGLLDVIRELLRNWGG